MSVQRYRHIGFVKRRGPNYGKPLMRLVNEPGCLDTPLEGSFGAKHRDFVSRTASDVFGVPEMVIAAQCCDIHDPPGVEKVEEASSGITGGVTQRMIAFVEDVNNCPAARDRRVTLTYSAGAGDACGADPGCSTATGRWTGSLTLNGGTVDLQVCCLAVGSWVLRVSGCVTTPSCHPGVVECADPLTVSFGNVSLAPDTDVAPGCCDCQNSDTPEINVTVKANCRQTVHARHIGFEDNSATPTMAMSNCSNGTNDRGCCEPSCGLKAIISGACGCLMDGATLGYYPMVFTGSSGGSESWAANITGCSNTGTIDATCTPNGDGTVTIAATVTCGAAHIATGSAVFADCPLDDLDVSIPMTMIGTATPCTGNCTSTYNMGSWTNTGSTCTPSCDPCPDTPPGIPPDVPDGGTYTFPCTGTGTSEGCCEGGFTLRLMR